jgi:hypothetical protein
VIGGVCARGWIRVKGPVGDAHAGLQVDRSEVAVTGTRGRRRLGQRLHALDTGRDHRFERGRAATTDLDRLRAGLFDGRLQACVLCCDQLLKLATLLDRTKKASAP